MMSVCYIKSGACPKGGGGGKGPPPRFKKNKKRKKKVIIPVIENFLLCIKHRCTH